MYLFNKTKIGIKTNIGLNKSLWFKDSQKIIKVLLFLMKVFLASSFLSTRVRLCQVYNLTI